MKHVSCGFPEHSRSSKARHRLNHSQTPTELQIAACGWRRPRRTRARRRSAYHSFLTAKKSASLCWSKTHSRAPPLAARTPRSGPATPENSSFSFFKKRATTTRARSSTHTFSVCVVGKRWDALFLGCAFPEDIPPEEETEKSAIPPPGSSIDREPPVDQSHDPLTKTPNVP